MILHNKTSNKRYARGGVEIFLVASCYWNRDKLRPNEPLGSYEDFTLPYYLSLRSIFLYISGTECLSCRSTISWDHCNTHKVEKTCPFRFEHCVTFSREKTHDSEQNANQANNITKTFVKDCALGSECSEQIPHCNEQSSVAETCTYECCHGNLCNAGTSSKTNPPMSLVFLLEIVLVIIFSSRTIEARHKRELW